MMNHRPGFTMVELLITISVLGILAGISVPSYANAQQKLRVQHAAAELADVVRQAQTKAIAGLDGLDVSVAISGSTATVSNTSRTISQWTAPAGITLSNTALTFIRKTGRTSSAPTIAVGDGSYSSSVSITTAGTIVAD